VRGSTKQRVVIVGGGFAGIGAARALPDGPEVTLIDRKPNFEFLPNIHEIVSGLKKPNTVGLSHERMARDLDQTFVQDEVTAIDPVQRTVITSSQRIPYDALVLAPGGCPAADGVAGAETHAHFFRSADDAERVRRRLDVLAGLPGGSHVTIVGGGFTGVEVLGEILRKYRKRRTLRVRLIDSGRRLMGDWPKVLHRRVKKIADLPGGNHVESLDDAKALARSRNSQKCTVLRSRTLRQLLVGVEHAEEILQDVI